MTEVTIGAIAEIVPVIVAPPVTARCARCNGQAYVEVALRFSRAMPGIYVDQVVGERLEFCGHHYTDHETALQLVAVKIIDHRPYLRSLEESKSKDNRR